MTISLLITNLSAAVVDLNDLYCDLGPSGTAKASITVTRSAAEIDRMVGLKTLVTAGTVSVALTQSTDNTDILSCPVKQHAIVGALAVDAIATVTSVVTFATPFASAPTIMLNIQQGTHTDWKARSYARSVTKTGFTIVLDVTTQSGTGGEKGSVAWMAIQ